MLFFSTLGENRQRFVQTVVEEVSLAYGSISTEFRPEHRWRLWQLDSHIINTRSYNETLDGNKYCGIAAAYQKPVVFFVVTCC